MQKKFTWLAALLIALLALTACAPTESDAEVIDIGDDDAMSDVEPDLSDVDPTGQNIIWWHQHTGGREELLNEIVARFNEENEYGITVEPQSQGGYDEIRDLMNASLAAGEQTAALIVGYQNDQAFYQLNDALVDLDTFINDPEYGLSEEAVDDFYPTFLQQGVHPEFGNERLGFPPNRSMEVLYYNQSWLEELGFSGPPTTPEEFREQACAAAEANADGTGGYILRDDASAMASWTYAFGGDILSEDGTTYQYDNPATIEAMTFLKELLDAGCAFFFTEGFPNPEFAARRALFTQGSSSGLPFYASDMATAAEEAGRDEDEWGVTAIPHTTDEPVQNIYGADVMIPVTTPEQELAAWIFVKWFTEPENQADWVRASNYFPTREGTDAFIEDYEAENPQWAEAADLLAFSAYEPQLISYTAVRDAAAQAFNEIMQGAEIESTLADLTEFANETQAELSAEVE